MARILVTGAGGFIGRRLAERLLAEDQCVIALDRDPGGLSGLASFAQGSRQRDRLEVICGDLAELPAKSILSDISVVAHVAGRGNVRASWTETDKYIRDNIEATIRLCHAVARVPAVQVFLLVSSSSVYGGPPPWSESSVLAPCSPYGRTKLAAEHAAGRILADQDVTLMTVRPFSVYGPRQRSDLVLSRLIDAAVQRRPFVVFGDGRQRRDFTFVDDVVDCMVRLLDRPMAGTYNLCAGQSHSVLELIRLVSELLGQRLTYFLECTTAIPAEPAHTLGINEAVQWACGPISWTMLRQGVARQIEWRLTVGTAPH